MVMSAAKAAKAARVDLSSHTQEKFKFLTGMVVADAQLALQANANAVGWYDKTVSQAMGALSITKTDAA